MVLMVKLGDKSLKTKSN